MKFNSILGDISKTIEFGAFEKQHPHAFLTAGFFVLDKETGKNVLQLDYFLPHENKVAAFTLGEKTELRLLDLVNSSIPEKLSSNAIIDTEELHGILHDEMRNRGMTEEIKKIVAVLQSIDGKLVWSLSCVLSGMEILKAKVEDSSKSVLSMQKSSILDFVKKVNPEELSKLSNNKLSKEDIKKEIVELDKAEAEIEKEKIELNKELDKN